MKRKLLAALLAGTMVLSMAACGNNDSGTSSPANESSSAEGSSGSSSAPTDTVTSSNEANAGSDSIPADAASSSNESNTATDTNNTGNTGDGSNFNTYNNEQQQQTSDTYVLNTSSHKVHYPSCASVKKIAPQNHATSSQSLDELLAQGYTTCGNCFK